ncbi:AraC family transcriptional regulator [Cellvibrio zantedeschiae]|uniref:AraC family transcriptional regulator n=1 Tax=Cellvibrio zantedeschiae TaxID=1237077 RepID=A0ABQ3AUI6_9GAMM|nr:helix-turn-helix domain-containing protein [Cellvibrio zantedeschiae]GGY64570.1 AraC family transcriptional regulator [Cellvibrio zantedeschiae]
MQQGIVHIYLFSAIFCLLLALSFLVSKKLQVMPARLLGLTYVLCTLQSFLAVLVFGAGWEFAAVLRASIAMILGPASYFYYCSLVDVDRTSINRWWLHLLPAVLVFVLCFFRSPLANLAELMIIASFAVYVAFTCRLLIGGRQRLQHLAQYADAAYRWLVILAALMAINFIIEILVYLELSTGVPITQSWAIMLGAAVFLLFHMVTLLLVITRAPLMEWMHALQDLRLSKAKPMSDAEAKDIFNRWERVVVERELYKKEGGVTLEYAGRILVIPARQISQAINRVYGGSFSQYLNDCRVKAAQTLLRNNPDMPITTLMLESGFSTKSNFNKEFLRVTGLSPSEYRK